MLIFVDHDKSNQNISIHSNAVKVDSVKFTIEQDIYKYR